MPSDIFLSGEDGATSLKEEICGRIPVLNGASQYRKMRQMLREELGGAAAIKGELFFAGYLDPSSNLLTTNEKPYNHFACVAAGLLVQPGMKQEQEALGVFGKRYVICSNKPENDVHWDSKDPLWMKKASMARRHRFLTTKDLHWQWFNAGVFGMVPKEEGGVDLPGTVKEVMAMKEAALHYTQKVGGWSDQIGLYVNVFGHNQVNSLFLHVLDLKERGPALDELNYKNCPLDAVLQVLAEEAAQGMKLVAQAFPSLDSNSMERQRFFYKGTEGATSLKAEITGRIPVLRDAATLREARRVLREELGGVMTLREELARAGFIDRATNLLTTGIKPFNIFARVAAGEMKQTGTEEENAALGAFKDKFVVCRNLPVNDEMWDSPDPEWLGKAAMSRRHCFLTTRDLHWRWFNVLVFGLVEADSESGGQKALQEAVEELEAMRTAALAVAAGSSGWPKPENVGLFLHVFGHNSVNSLHLHMVDMTELGPSFFKMAYKNCPLDAAIRVLREELAALSPLPATSIAEVVAAAEAARAAAAAAKLAAQASRAQLFALKARASSAMRRDSFTGNLVREGEGTNQVLEMNVGGEYVLSVPHATLRMAPAHSLFYSMLRPGLGPQALDTGTCPTDGSVALPPHRLDARGTLFLDVPPEAFRRIVDHLRLLRLAPKDRFVRPPVLEPGDEREFWTLAEMLGLGAFLRKGTTRPPGGSPRLGFTPPPDHEFRRESAVTAVGCSRDTCVAS